MLQGGHRAPGCFGRQIGRGFLLIGARRRELTAKLRRETGLTDSDRQLPRIALGWHDICLERHSLLGRAVIAPGRLGRGWLPGGQRRDPIGRRGRPPGRGLGAWWAAARPDRPERPASVPGRAAPLTRRWCPAARPTAAGSWLEESAIG